MPRAAVPAYLGKHLEKSIKHASPAMRFGMYLPTWTSREDQEQSVDRMASRRSPKAAEVGRTRDRQGMDAAINRYVKEGLWEKNDSAARPTWEVITGINDSDRRRMTALVDRQNALVAGLPGTDRFTVDAVGIAPFVTGMGNEHPLENGFAFLDPHGLPYLPGSGVKGVLRTAARELASGEWGDTHGWDQMLPVRINAKRREMRVIDLLLGHDPGDGQRPGADLFRGLLDCWDVIPEVKGSLMVEIMTPHQGDYYRGNATPHDSGQPNPIRFLAVPPGSGYTFHLRVDSRRLRALGLDTTLGTGWKPLLEAAFAHAFEWLGFGAKTSLGYGAMMADDARREQREQAEQDRGEIRARQGMSPEEQAIADFRKATEEARQLGYTPGDTFDGERNAFIKTATAWSDPGLRAAAAEALDDSFSNRWGASKKKLKELKQTVRELRGD